MSTENSTCTMGLIFFIFLLLITGNIVIAGAAAISPPPAASAPDPVSLYLRWHHQFQFAGYYAAKEKGYYEAAGIAVTITEGGMGSSSSSLVAKQAGRYGVSSSEILLNRLHGKPLVVLAAIFQKSPIVLFAREDKGITTPQDLIGKQVMMESKIANPELWAILLNEGISPGLIHNLKGEFTKKDYLNPQLDAISGYITDQSYLFQKNGIAITYIKPTVYGIDFYGDSLFTSESEVKSHPERAKAFREASLKGWEYAMANPDEIIDLIINKYGTSLSKEHLQFEAQEMQKLIIPDLIEIGHMNPGRWKHIADTLVRLQMVKPNYSLAGFIYDPNQSVNYHWIKWGIIITLILAILGSLVIIALLTFNKRLQKEIRVRRQTEEKLRTANEQAIAATHAKSEFLAKMSHEIRTPMNGVIGMANLLAHTSLNHEQNEYVEAIRISGNNLLRIINNILDFTKIEAGKMEVQEEVFNINSCIQEILTIFKQKLTEKNISIQFCIAPGVPLYIKSDMALIKQILINLVNNAIKFMEKGEISLSLTTILIKNNRVTLKCSVKDEGIGIPEDKLTSLFDAFSQADSTNSRKYEGTGLGLAISKQLVELLGGNIWVKSKPGVGSTFFFTIEASISDEQTFNTQLTPKKECLFLNPPELAEQTLSNPLFAEPEKEMSKGVIQVLVAEDNKINQKLVVKLLSKMGYQVEVANNGTEVLKALEQKYYPLILMDIQMPEMDGVEATRIIMSQYSQGNRPKIIALTANALQGDKEKYLEMGMVDYISKPINIPKLKDTMAKWSEALTSPPGNYVSIKKDGVSQAV